MTFKLIQGTSGNDSRISDETFYGKPSFGNPLNEKFLLYEGNDLAAPGRGADYIDGGAGVDTVSYYFFSVPVNIDLEKGTVKGMLGTDTLIGIEGVFGSKSTDTIVGNNANNFITGANGNDTIYGSLGNDTLNGNGTNSVDAVADVINYGKLTVGVKVDLNLNQAQKIGLNKSDQLSNFEYVYGSRFNDTLIGDSKNNLLVGSDGKDFLTGGDGDDSLVGYSISDYGLQEIDTLTGGAGADKFILNWYNNQVPYDDGNTSDLNPPSPALFGMNNVTSVIGWRVVKEGSSFHKGIDYGSGGQPKDIKAGVFGTVTKAGGDGFNLIAIRLKDKNTGEYNGNTVEYLHCSQVNVSVGQAVTPSTIIGKTGGVATPKPVDVHLHLQAKNSLEQVIHPAAALNTLTTDNNYTQDKWSHGLKDYALIQDFNLAVDKIILPKTASHYYPIYCPPSRGNIFPTPGTAIVFDNDGFAGQTALHKADELVAFIPNQKITTLTGGGFSFTGI